MLSKSDASGFWVYGWDYENRMTTVRKQNKVVRYQYDALGRRVFRHGKGVGATAKYTYDGLDVILDDGSEGVVKYQNGLGIDDKLKMAVNGNAKYFLQDHLGSTVGLVDSNGAVVSSASYDSFGNSTNNLATRYQYTGREKDEFTGLLYYRARWYDANLGRFISEDPLSFAGGDVNLYGYVWNNPIAFVDSSGNIPVPVITGGIGALAGGLGTILGKGLSNLQCGRSFFNGADSLDYWKDVAIGVGGGAVTGALLGTGLGASLTGTTLIGAGGNAGQYLVSAGLGRTQFSYSGLTFSAATGALGGYVGGKLTIPSTQPINPRIVKDPLDKLIIYQGNREANQKIAASVATGLPSLGRSLGGGAVSNGVPNSDSCGCQ